MIAVLVGKECRALLRDGRLAAFSLAVLVMFIAVLWVAHGESERRRTQKHDLEQQTREQWDGQGDKHPHRGAHFGLYVFAPESVLAAFDPGVQPHLGEAIWLEPHRRNLSRLSSIPEDVMYGRLGEFTPAFVLIAILPLLIVTAAHGAIAGERETGTLRLVRGMGMRLAAFVWSKVFALALAIAVLIAAVFGIILALSGDAARTSLLAATYLVYCIIFIAIGFTVSALSATSRNALLVLVAVWLTFVWAVPRAGAAFAAGKIDLPTAVEFWGDIRRDYQEGLPGDPDLATRGRLFDEQLLRQHGVSKLEDLPFGAYAVRRLNRDAYADRVHELHFERLWRRFTDQESQLRRAVLLSPVIAMRLISMKLSGTDLRHRKDFEDAAERYRQYFNTHIDRWDEHNSVGLRSFDERYGNDALWRSVQRFEYRAMGTRDVLRDMMPELAALGAWAAAALIVLAVAVRRVRV